MVGTKSIACRIKALQDLHVVGSASQLRNSHLSMSIAERERVHDHFRAFP